MTTNPSSMYRIKFLKTTPFTFHQTILSTHTQGTKTRNNNNHNSSSSIIHSSTMFEIPKDGVVPVSIQTEASEYLVQVGTHVVPPLTSQKLLTPRRHPREFESSKNTLTHSHLAPSVGPSSSLLPPQPCSPF